MQTVEQLGQNAKKCEKSLIVNNNLKNIALQNISKLLLENINVIIEENKKDLDNARENGLSEAMIDRLCLNEDRIKAIADGVLQVLALQDPVGNVLSGHISPEGLKIKKITVPLGVIGIIYESRPNVTVDAAALCLKAGNMVILRGGKEAINSNKCLVGIMREALKKSSLPEDCIQLVGDTSRNSAKELMELSDYLDVLIPRGGKGLIDSVVKNAKVPVIQTGAGNCHIYVDEFANINMACDIIYNAKTSRPSVCNAAETILVHKNIAPKALPAIKESLSRKNVKLHCCSKSFEILGKVDIKATQEDWSKEYLDYEVAVKVVDNIEDAISHISTYSTGHSEAIITENYSNAQTFINQIDSAAVYVNASTRFTDGGMFGMGAEIGISTQKLHARGPMGINQLTSSKFIIEGNGQIR
ncbi:MAG: glutamate-5-semialdehyde dehydrogenase [Clostridia bacterium]|nr:glutamate-5-semialdehyde dehydrogenase [Clostridia bacterium]